MGRAAVEVLEHAGVEVVVGPQLLLRRPALSQGMLEKPRRWAAENLAELGGLVDEGYEIVCPSNRLASRPCATTTEVCSRRLHMRPIRSSARMQQRSFDVTEYLVLLPAGRAPRDCAGPLSTRPTWCHGHCHQKSLGIGSAPAELLRLIPGATVHEVEALCCGMVGSFGYKKEYSSLSRAIGAQLFDQIEQTRGDVVACGVSCRSQIEMGTGRPVVHPVEVMAKALRRPG